MAASLDAWTVTRTKASRSSERASQVCDSSECELKENIRDITTAEAVDALEQLRPRTFNYKADTGESYAGFIAEEVPDLVATNDRKGLAPMDVVAVLTKVVQEQKQQIDALQERLDALEATNAQN